MAPGLMSCVQSLDDDASRALSPSHILLYYVHYVALLLRFDASRVNQPCSGAGKTLSLLASVKPRNVFFLNPKRATWQVLLRLCRGHQNF